VACVEALLAVQTLAGLLGATALAAHVVWNVADRRHLSDIPVIPGSLALGKQGGLHVQPMPARCGLPFVPKLVLWPAGLVRF
jgi:hypothetical protein